MMLKYMHIKEGLALIAALNSAKPVSRLPIYAQDGEGALQSGLDGVHRGEQLPCFGSSIVYNCTKNSCSAFQRCTQAVSPWLPG